MTKKQPAHPRIGADYRSALAALIRKKISQLTPVDFMLAVHVYACLEDEEGPVRSSIAELAAATGLSCRTVQSCRAHLIRSGILELNSTSRERSAYDLPRTLPPAAVEPEQAQPAIAPAKPALPAPLPHQSTPSILVDAPV